MKVEIPVHRVQTTLKKSTVAFLNEYARIFFAGNRDMAIRSLLEKASLEKSGCVEIIGNK